MCLKVRQKARPLAHTEAKGNLRLKETLDVFVVRQEDHMDLQQAFTSSQSRQNETEKTSSGKLILYISIGNRNLNNAHDSQTIFKFSDYINNMFHYQF